jgi:hypothetical protein
MWGHEYSEREGREYKAMTGEEQPGNREGLRGEGTHMEGD